MNARVLRYVVEELGYRVSIDTLEVHLQSFYQMCNATGGFLATGYSHSSHRVIFFEVKPFIPLVASSI